MSSSIQTQLPGVREESREFHMVADPALRENDDVPRHGPTRALWLVDVDAYDSAPEAAAAALATVSRFECPECGTQKFLGGSRCAECGCDAERFVEVDR